MNIGKRRSGSKQYYNVSYRTVYPYRVDDELTDIARISVAGGKDIPAGQPDRIYSYNGSGSLMTVKIADGTKRSIFGGEAQKFREIRFRN